MSLIEASGTTISRYDECEEDLRGVYAFDEKEGVDDLVICENNIDINDSSDVWEVLAHEATHVMQACVGGPVLTEAMHPRVVREIQTKAPHFYEILGDGYHGGDFLLEAEAFWMELQHPDFVMEIFSLSCFSEE